MKRKYKIGILLLIFFVIIIIQVLKDINNYLATNSLSFQDWYWEFSYVKSNSPEIIDNPLLYGNDEDDRKIEDIYIVILPTIDEDGSEITFEMLNDINDFREEIPELNIRVLNTDSQGVFHLKESLNAATVKNALISLRGHSTMEAREKSYKIRMKDIGETVLGYDRLNLNKHPFDYFKVRNKIVFQLMEYVPNIVSVRTKLVNLYIKDLSQGKDESFVDYGLFTNIEQIDQKFLQDHKLDTKCNLYKAEYFEFVRYEENIKNVKDPNYNKKNFEEHLEIKVGKSHEKIIGMLDDVNNCNLDINKVLDKHFNRDNYFTWLAVNILLGNYDTQTQNYYLYSPRDSLTWYFIPWDYDDSMNHLSTPRYDRDGNITNHIGVANYWNNIIHARVFMNPDNLRELNKKIEEVYRILTKEAIEKEVRKYLPLVEKYYLENPRSFQNISKEEFYDSIEEIINITENNRRLYYQTLEKPMPIFLGDVTKLGDGYLFEWTDSFDLQGDRLSYTLEVSKSPNFEELVFQKKRLRDHHYILDLDPGEYYWRVIVVDSKDYTQIPFDQVILDNIIYYGIRNLIID